MIGTDNYRSRGSVCQALSAALVTLVCVAGAEPARAQSHSEPRRYASATVGASVGDGNTAATVSAALGFSFLRRVGIELELSYAGHLAFALDPCPAPRTCPATGPIPVTGRTVSLVPYIVVDLAPRRSRVRPYAVAGAGMTHLRQWYLIDPATERKRSTRAATFSVGGGVAVQLTPSIALGADIRSVRLFDDAAAADRFILPAGTITTLRIGSRVNWRF